MCSVFGVTLPKHASLKQADVVQINQAWFASRERGRDGCGLHTVDHLQRTVDPRETHNIQLTASMLLGGWAVGNWRAEPTTEYVEQKQVTDQQPYRYGNWTVVHNGTIANDVSLRELASCGGLRKSLPTKIDSAAIAELLNHLEADGHYPERSAAVPFREMVAMLKGSFAIIAVHLPTGMMFTASNYRPIWKATTWIGEDAQMVLLGSSRHVLKGFAHREMLAPYTINVFQDGKHLRRETIRPPTNAERQWSQQKLVVCSGGLDSTVAAAAEVAAGHKVTLLHFRYGCRAEGREVSSIWRIASALGVGVIFKYMDVYSPDDSPLLRADSAIAGGEAGAEFAHEWVPARNLIMLALATGHAEANGFDSIVLGNNLEEAGAYPDNEPEFIDRFNDLLPFAVGDGKQLKVEMPVGNLMKHEIVALGLKVNAPMDKTWSCYRNGDKHCGTCGPCFMRRTAFKINNAVDPIEYEG